MSRAGVKGTGTRKGGRGQGMRGDGRKLGRRGLRRGVVPVSREQVLREALLAEGGSDVAGDGGDEDTGEVR